MQVVNSLEVGLGVDLLGKSLHSLDSLVVPVVLLVLAAVEVVVVVVVALPLVQAPADLLGYFGSLVLRPKCVVVLAVVLVGGTLNQLPTGLLMLLVGLQGELTLW